MPETGISHQPLKVSTSGRAGARVAAVARELMNSGGGSTLEASPSFSSSSFSSNIFTSNADLLIQLHSNGCGEITLRRVRALNSLSSAMVNAIASALLAWRTATEPALKFVLIRSESDKAFCVGGDIRKQALPPFTGYAETSFHNGYILIHIIHRYHVPIVSLVNGIVMGGGVALSIHGTFRAVTDDTLFAMPETGIGLFPDLGASYFLSRLGAVGMFIGVSGERLRTTDIGHVGIGTHYVQRASFPELISRLKQIDLSRALSAPQVRSELDAMLKSFSSNPGAAPLSGLSPVIERCFGSEVKSVEDCLARLQDVVSDPSSTDLNTSWAKRIHASILTKSPTSLKLAFRLIRSAAAFNFEQALQIEYRLGVRVARCVLSADFREGVRALIIDKDQKPNWQPSSLQQVTEHFLDAYFAPFSDADFKFYQSNASSSFVLTELVLPSPPIANPGAFVPFTPSPEHFATQ